jgi:hypothetical protein
LNGVSGAQWRRTYKIEETRYVSGVAWALPASHGCAIVCQRPSLPSLTTTRRSFVWSHRLPPANGSLGKRASMQQDACELRMLVRQYGRFLNQPLPTTNLNIYAISFRIRQRSVNYDRPSDCLANSDVIGLREQIDGKHHHSSFQGIDQCERLSRTSKPHSTRCTSSAHVIFHSARCLRPTLPGFSVFAT